MPDIVFPPSPTIGQIYTAPNGVSYVWDGTKWTGQFNATSITPRTSLTGSSVIPAGNTSQRDPTPQTGYLRYNTALGLEVYSGTGWTNPGAPVLRNRLINGSMVIQQRPSAVTIIANNNAIYGKCDRWYGAINSATGGSMTLGAGSLTYNSVSYNTCRATVVSSPTDLSGANFYVPIVQWIEGFNAYDLVGQPLTVSFVFNTNVTGTYSVSLRDSTSSQAYISTFSATASAPQRYTFSIPAVPMSAVIPCDNGAGLQLLIGSLATGSLASATTNAWIPGAAITTATVTNWAAAPGNYVEVTLVQLEAGPVATPFEFRPVSIELSLAQRYYQRETLTLASQLETPNLDGVQAYFLPIDLPLPMRVQPNVGAESVSYLNSTGLQVGATGTRTIQTVLTPILPGATANYWGVTFSYAATAELNV